jgi:hypothetical protein
MADAEGMVDMLLVGEVEAVASTAYEVVGEVGPVGVTRPPGMVPREGEPLLVLVPLERLISARRRPGTYSGLPAVPIGRVARHESLSLSSGINIVPLKRDLTNRLK